MTSRSALAIVPDALCMLMCAGAVATDLKSYRIPNWLSLAGAVTGLALNAALAGWYLGSARGVAIGLAGSLGGALLLLLVFGAFGALGFVGMGDVKLMAAVGALLGWPLALVALAYSTICGGLLAVGYALVRGEMREVLRNMRALAGRTLGLARRSAPDRTASVRLHRIPYALAILLGVVWTILGRYVPGVRWP